MTTAQFQTLEQGSKQYPMHNSFMAAWLDMYQYVSDLLNRGELSPQILETAMWIEIQYEGTSLPIYFYEARDRAIEDGWKLPA